MEQVIMIPMAAMKTECSTLSLLEQFNHNDAMNGASVGIAGVDPLPACMMFFEVCLQGVS